MIDVSELERFARACEAAKADLKPYAGKVLEEAGEEFLDIVQTEIVRCGNINFGDLHDSFTKGGALNIYRLDTGALILTIGTKVPYAKWVNDGHRQQPGRFIPGFWEGNHFRYSPGAKTGMVLKASFVAGSHYFDKSKQVLKTMFPQMADRAFEQFFKRYFP